MKDDLGTLPSCIDSPLSFHPSCPLLWNPSGSSHSIWKARDFRVGKKGPWVVGCPVLSVWQQYGQIHKVFYTRMPEAIRCLKAGSTITDQLSWQLPEVWALFRIISYSPPSPVHFLDGMKSIYVDILTLTLNSLSYPDWLGINWWFCQFLMVLFQR